MRRRTSGAIVFTLLGVLALHGAAVSQGGPGRGLGPEAAGPGPGAPPGPDRPGIPPGEFGPPPGGGMIGLRLPPRHAMERLGLSDAQRTKLDALLDDGQRKAIRMDGEMRIAELDLQKLVESEKPDETAIATAVERLSAIRTEMLRARVATVLGFRAILTVQQRARLRRPPSDSRWH